MHFNFNPSDTISKLIFSIIGKFEVHFMYSNQNPNSSIEMNPKLYVSKDNNRSIAEFAEIYVHICILPV